MPTPPLPLAAPPAGSTVYQGMQDVSRSPRNASHGKHENSVGSAGAEPAEHGDVFGRMVSEHLENGVDGTAKAGSTREGSPRPGTGRADSARPGADSQKGPDTTGDATPPPGAGSAMATDPSTAGAVLATLTGPLAAGTTGQSGSTAPSGTTDPSGTTASAGTSASTGAAQATAPVRTAAAAGPAGVPTRTAARAATAPRTTGTDLPAASTGAPPVEKAGGTAATAGGPGSTGTATTGPTVPTAAVGVTRPAHAGSRGAGADHHGPDAVLAAQAAAGTPASPATSTAATSTGTDARAKDGGSGGHASEPAAPAAATAPADATSANAVPSVAPTPAAAPTSASATAAGPASPVVDQVLTALPRMVLRGDGTSRLTLKLHPADLGEVHVTVTVKGGAVDVSLAADARARAALGAGSDRLRGLLESLGHSSGQVVVRELPGGPVPAAGSGPLGGQTGGQTGSQPAGSWTQSWGQGAGQQPPGHPGTSADLSGFAGREGRQADPGTTPSGRDDTTSGTTGTPFRSSTSHPRVHGGASGLDVTV